MQYTNLEGLERIRQSFHVFCFFLLLQQIKSHHLLLIGMNLDKSSAYKVSFREYYFDELFAQVNISLMKHVNHGLLLQPAPIQVEFASKMADHRTCLWQLEGAIAKTRKLLESLQHNKR